MCCNIHTLISDMTESKPPISCHEFGIFKGSINNAAIVASYSVSYNREQNAMNNITSTVKVCKYKINKIKQTDVQLNYNSKQF